MIRLLDRLGVHARVFIRAIIFGLLAYGFIHLLIFAIHWLKSAF